MNLETVLAYTAVATVAILSPGPAILLALRNSVAFGLRSVVWSSLGNISGLFCLSSAAMLGLGLLLNSSAVLFSVVKVLGALYLFYVGIRHLFGRTSAFASDPATPMKTRTSAPLQLYREAFLMAAINPKPILFFTALFPQFISAREPLLPQFLILTGIFMTLSFITLLGYASVAGRARALLRRPRVARWVDRTIGTVFISFGTALLSLRRVAP